MAGLLTGVIALIQVEALGQLSSLENAPPGRLFYKRSSKKGLTTRLLFLIRSHTYMLEQPNRREPSNEQSQSFPVYSRAIATALIRLLRQAKSG
jgi:hypothetical protein